MTLLRRAGRLVARFGDLVSRAFGNAWFMVAWCLVWGTYDVITLDGIWRWIAAGIFFACIPLILINWRANKRHQALLAELMAAREKALACDCPAGPDGRAPHWSTCPRYGSLT